MLIIASLKYTLLTVFECVSWIRNISSNDRRESSAWTCIQRSHGKIMTSLYSGTVCIWNYQSQEIEKSFKLTESPDFIRSVAVHPTLPYVLSSSDDMHIKLWDWEKDWVCAQIFEGHSHYVMQVAFNPRDTSTFASVSLDGSFKLWNLGSSNPNLTLEAHSQGINCVDFITAGDTPYLITGSDDQTVKVWDYENETCVQILEGHKHNITAVCVHPEVPIIITGSEDMSIRIWHATTYRLLFLAIMILDLLQVQLITLPKFLRLPLVFRLESTVNYELGRVWSIGCMKSSPQIAIGYDEGTIMGNVLCSHSWDTVNLQDQENVSNVWLLTEMCCLFAMRLHDWRGPQPLRLEIKRKLAQRSERVKSVDLHPTEPWILASLYSGTVCIWNYQSQTMAKSFEVTELPVRSAKFIARKQWVVAGADDMYIRVYNYNTMDKVKVFEAHTDYIRCVAVHPTLPYVLSSSDDMLIKLWDWEKSWVCTQIFEGHSHYVMQVTFNPKDTNTFASASLDRTIKIWNLGSPDPNFTLDAHLKGVNCVDYFTGGDKPYLITGSDDHTAKVLRMVLSVYGIQPLIGNIRLENTLNYGLERVWAIGYMKGSRRVVIGYDEGTIMVKIGREEPVASMDNSGKIIWAKHNEIQTVNIKSVGADYEVSDGERLPLAVKELGTCDLYPQSLKHNPNGRFVVVCGDGEYIIYTALAWRNRSFGAALEIVWSSDGEYAVRESTSKIKIFSKNFQEKKSIRPTFSAERIYGGTLLAMCSNDFICFYDWSECRLIRRIDVNVKNLYWADSGDLVAIASDTSFYMLKYNRDVVSAHLDSGRSVDEQGVEDAFELLYEINERVRTGIWVGDCFIYNNSSWRLNYCVGGEVTTMFHLDRPMYLLGYLANQSRVFLIDKEFNVIGYTLLLSLIEYKTLVMRGDLEQANQVLPSIPKEHLNSVARFLESRGMIEDALEVATDPDYRFELAIQLGKLDIAKDIAAVAQSESKWKQLGELAMSTGMIEMAEECLKHANDLSGLLLLYSSLGDAEEILKLASLAKDHGKNNVAFLCLFMLGRLEECLQLLVDSNRIPEAALMARSYLPSKVSEIVALWRKDLNKVNQKAAESLADPEEYSNLFENWQIALDVESRVEETRGKYPPAAEYVNYADRPYVNLVEAFINMQVDEEEPLENGGLDHEVAEQNGEMVQEEEQDDGQEEGQEEPVVVDADSTDGAVLVNGNEADEEWGTNNEGNPSA
ncbi:hypothetical protein RJ639_037783 [Escallonia herrerae]|uniref:Beta'-coat protein n=1 Tax=Escallonia herrerae TaxID=1293975 RepID=A0AA89BD27_9ASTE|nr:hypothetical protein RJ639_037783 [Escallonia herrerae]